MAFTNGNFKEAGGPGNEVSGGQVYSYHSSTDTLATILASGYFDSIQDVLNDRDVMIITGSDGLIVAEITNTAGVITTTGMGGAGTTDAVSGAGTASLLTALTLHTTSGGANVLTIPDGLYPGQRKSVTCVVDDTSSVVTPTTTIGAWATITLLVVGDSCDLMWTGAGWIIMGVGPGANTAGNPVVA